MSKKIAILTGGPWLEAEIAVKSATLFTQNITEEYDYYELPRDKDLFLEKHSEYTLAIPVFHGEYWEDGKIFAFLEILWIPHTFSNYDTHSTCLDKYKTNLLAESIGINVPDQYIFDIDLAIYPKNFPVIVKPNKWGSSFHTYKIENLTDFKEKTQLMNREVNDDILVQEFIIGDEYSIPMVAGAIIPTMMVEKKNPEDIFDYNSKYESEDTMREIFPVIQKDLAKILNTHTHMLYNFFKIKWCARIDFLVQWEKIYFLEVNTIPGMTPESILPKAWKLTGKSLPELVDTIMLDI